MAEHPAARSERERCLRILDAHRALHNKPPLHKNESGCTKSQSAENLIPNSAANLSRADAHLSIGGSIDESS